MAQSHRYQPRQPAITYQVGYAIRPASQTRRTSDALLCCAITSHIPFAYPPYTVLQHAGASRLRLGAHPAMPLTLALTTACSVFWPLFLEAGVPCTYGTVILLFSNCRPCRPCQVHKDSQVCFNTGWPSGLTIDVARGTLTTWLSITCSWLEPSASLRQICRRSAGLVRRIRSTCESLLVEWVAALPKRPNLMASCALDQSACGRF